MPFVNCEWPRASASSVIGYSKGKTSHRGHVCCSRRTKVKVDVAAEACCLDGLNYGEVICWLFKVGTPQRSHKQSRRRGRHSSLRRRNNHHSPSYILRMYLGIVDWPDQSLC